MRAERFPITRLDMLRLADVLEAASRWPAEDRQGARALRSRVARAEVVSEHEMPLDVIVLQSRVRLKDLDDGSDSSCRLVVPAHANVAADRISVLSPLGAALLGRRQGDAVEYPVPDGRRQLRIELVLVPPETAGRRLSRRDGESETGRPTRSARAA
jgi:regulator of nucleoside diphosphate kinase